eukprot:CAMPEP_0202825906 /NCGR_PEP_ID=MMETSP1389-20130828/13285_1 /ASSEMBLY_ACC=CAM_ASM_000865 /TAXON_ID=302021 /ORGANISM="Rhodomonas sp., Strain CCMP768" /LENGTH=229 /DNA_ID=CAMNT_0049499155 /DNA_START=40 /DNA_END=729 /DNA_ORIENTATION=+
MFDLMMIQTDTLTSIHTSIHLPSMVDHSLDTHALATSNLPHVCFGADNQEVPCANDAHNAMHCYAEDGEPMPCHGSDEHATGIKCFDKHGDAAYCTNEDGNVDESYDKLGEQTRTATHLRGPEADYCYTRDGNPTSCGSCTAHDGYSYVDSSGHSVTTANCDATAPRTQGLLNIEEQMVIPTALGVVEEEIGEKMECCNSPMINDDALRRLISARGLYSDATLRSMIAA